MFILFSQYKPFKSFQIFGDITWKYLLQCAKSLHNFNLQFFFSLVEITLHNSIQVLPEVFTTVKYSEKVVTISDGPSLSNSSGSFCLDINFL